MTRIPNEFGLAEQLFRARQHVERMPGGDDLFQVVCVKVLTERTSRNWNNDQAAFIRTVARRSSIDMYRMNKVRTNLWSQSESLNPASDHEADCPVKVALRIEKQTLVRECVNSLPEPYYSTIVASYFENKSPDEIAQLQKVPVETVKTRLKRAMERLRVSELRHYAADA